MEWSPLQKQNKAITSLGTLGRQTYGGTLYKRWEVSQYLGITACKGDKNFSGLFKGGTQRALLSYMQEQRAFLMEGSFSCSWNWWEAYTYSGDISCALPAKDKTAHKPLFCPVLPSSHPKPTSLGWEHLKPRKFLPWPCHEGLFLVNVYM